MSNYYLCDRCRRKVRYRDGMVECMASDELRDVAVMVDHGHANGRRPYDEPTAVCRDFEYKREDACR